MEKEQRAAACPDSIGSSYTFLTDFLLAGSLFSCRMNDEEQCKYSLMVLINTFFSYPPS